MLKFKLCGFAAALFSTALCLHSPIMAQDAAPPQPQSAPAANGSLARAAELIADRVAEYAKTRDQKTILVAEFKGTDLSGGRAIEAAVRERLENRANMTILKNESEVVKQKGWTLEGRISVQTDKGLATVKVDLLDSTGTEMDSFKEEFNDPSTAAGSQIQKAQELAPPEAVRKDPTTLPITGNDASVLTGRSQDVIAEVAEEAGKSPAELIAPPAQGEKPATSTLPPGLGGKIAEEVRIASFQKPSVDVKGTVVRPASESLFGMTIWMKNTPDSPLQPVSARNTEGIARVDLPENSLYEVEIINSSPVAIGVEVIIDGINVLRFAENKSIAASGKWLVPPTPPGSNPRRITGWFRKSGPGGTDRFRVSNSDQSVAVHLGEAHNTGMVQARFFTVREKSTAAPVIDEILAGASGKGGGFTAKGQQIDNQVVIRDAVFGTEPLALVTVRYDNPPEDLPAP
jgi:hypothetical protein